MDILARVGVVLLLVYLGFIAIELVPGRSASASYAVKTVLKITLVLIAIVYIAGSLRLHHQ
jgi:hypothetical protein